MHTNWIMKTVIILFSIVHFTSFAQPDEQLIQSQSALFSQNYIAGDFEAMAEAYTLDAIVCPPSKDIIVGKGKIYDYWSGLPKNTILMHRSEPVELRLIGDEAHEYGYYYTQSQKENGEKNPIYSAKYYIIWKKVSGTWKMKMDMWNNRDQNWDK